MCAWCRGVTGEGRYARPRLILFGKAKFLTDFGGILAPLGLLVVALGRDNIYRYVGWVECHWQVQLTALYTRQWHFHLSSVS